MQKNFQGFTLAELLIALGILGVIATFAIPKILTAQADNQCRAVFKETIGALSGLVYEDVVLKKTLGWQGTHYNGDILLDQINAIKICDGNSEMLGCWDDSKGTLPGSSLSGVVLSSGAVAVGPGLSVNGWTSISIDCNGSAPPNQFLKDQISVVACYDNVPCDNYGRMYKPGTLYPNIWGGPSGNVDSTPLYEDLFSH